MRDLGLRAKAAARVLAGTSTDAKDAGLHAAADLLVERVDELLDANAIDVARAEESGASPTIVDRLRLSPARVEAMAAGPAEGRPVCPTRWVRSPTDGCARTVCGCDECECRSVSLRSCTRTGRT